jgi:hypothetical protein
LRFASHKALKSLLALMRRHLAGTTEFDATFLGSIAAFAGPGTDELTLEFG